MPTAGWIVPPSLRNNGINCVFIQVKKLVVYFNSRAPFSLCGDFSMFSHMKQGNKVYSCKAYTSSHNGVAKEEVPGHLDGCLWFLLSAIHYVPTMVHDMVEVDLH